LEVKNFIRTVALNEVRFFSYHGFYPEEQLIGSVFWLNLSVDFYANADSENLAETINYENLNELLIVEMANTQQLLETVVQRILDRLLTQYPFLLSAQVSIRKQSPPMQGEVGSSEVGLRYSKS
jgi:dihydroneopterin aldolase